VPIYLLLIANELIGVREEDEEEDEEMGDLDEEDLELLEENTGTRIERRNKAPKRIRRGRDDDNDNEWETLSGRGDGFWTMIIAACHREVETLETSGMMTAFGVSVELERRMKTSPPNLETICAISLRMMMKMKTFRWERLRGRNDWSRDARKQHGNERRVDVLKWLV
jgi:hypothetical protein